MRKILFSTMVLCLLAVVAFAQVTLPPAPTGLTVTQVSSGAISVKLTWTVPTGMYGFKVYRSIDDTLHFEKIALVGSTIYNDYSVKVGHTFYYYVTTVAYNSSSTRELESGRSNVVGIAITAPERVTGIIKGTVKDDSTGKPILGITVYFYPLHPRNATLVMLSAITDSLGQYSAKLDTGAYQLKVQPAFGMSYLEEWYNNKKSKATADTLTLLKDSTLAANFGLSKPVVITGVIKGTVIDDSSQLPIPGVLIRFYRKGALTSFCPLPAVMTDSLGKYSATLDSGTYLVRAEGVIRPTVKIVYLPEWFDNVTDVSLATPVVVASGSSFTANFGLTKPVPPIYYYVEGTVTDTLGNPLRNATVVLRRSFQEMIILTATSSAVASSTIECGDIDGVGYCRGAVWSGKTDSLGKYKAKVLGGYNYVAMASKWGYLPEYYNNQTDPLLADIIAVNADVKNVNFSLAPNPIFQNSISGIVRDSTGTGVPSVVILIPVRPNAISRKMQFGHTDSTGAYTIGNVVTGTYVVLAVPFAGYAPAFYKAGAYGVMRWQLADQVQIKGDTSGIDIGVEPITSTGFVRLRGRILASGAALPGVRVTAFGPTGALIGYGLTNSTGYYDIDALPAGSVTIVADRQDYASSQQSVAIPSNQYSVTASDLSLNATTTDVAAEEAIPETYVLNQNYPNPFNPATVLSYQLPVAGNVKLAVFDLLGREVGVLVNGRMAAGSHDVTWNAKNLASGVYFYRLSVKDGEKTLFSSVKKMVLVR
jgi:hypothetical protein